MRKISLIFATAFAVLSVSCSKESEIQNEQKDIINGKEVLLTINASGENTKTYIDGTSVKWASTGEFLEVYQDKNSGTITHKTSSEGTTSNSGATMSFEVGFDATTGTSFDYYAVYPASKVQDASGSLSQKLNTPATQTPTATSFDPTADLLIAKKVSNGSSQATSLNMQFSRAIAVGKMTITNLASSDPIKKVVFSAVDNSVAVKLAGRTEFNLETAKPSSTYANNVAETSIILDYSGLSLTANSSMDAFFTCYPFALTAGDSFTVQVQTASKTYTRTVTLAGAQKLTFVPGSASRFSVDMSTASATDNAVDLRYVCLTGAEYEAAGATSSYGNLTVNKPHGDNWVTYALKSDGSIQIKNTANTGDPGYVKLPDLSENIKTVVVTLKTAVSAGSGKYISLETTASSTGGTVSSTNYVNSQTEYTFDLTSESVKTAYLRSTGAAAKVTKIEVYAGEDNRAAKISATESVNAELNNDSPSVTNKIDVSWTAVENAAGYEVTLTPTSGEPVVQSVAANVVSTSFTDLAYSTSYTASIVTIADPYLFKANSDSKAAASAVVTGAQPSTHVSDITNAGSYTISGLTVMAVSGKNVIAADNTGTILIYKSGHGLAINDVFTISGGVQKYHEVWEYNSSITITKTGTTTASYPAPVSYDAAKITSYVSSPVIEYATATGSANKDARTVTVAEGKVLNVYGDLTSVDGKQAIVTGYVFGYDSSTSKVDFMLVGTPTVDPSIPSLTTDPTDGSALTWENNESGNGNAKSITITLNGSATGYTVSHSGGDTSEWNIADNGSGTLTYSPQAANSSTTTDKTLTVTITHKDNTGITSVITLKQKKQSSGTKDYYKLITNLDDVTEGTYVVGALRSESTTDNFYFGKATVSSGDWQVSSDYVTVAAVDGVRRFEIEDLPSEAVEFTFTGDNTNGFTISNSTKYLYFTNNINRKLSFAAAGSTYKWKVVSKDSPLVTGGICLSAVGSQNYTISENSTAVGAIRGYASTTKYRAIYLFKKVTE